MKLEKFLEAHNACDDGAKWAFATGCATIEEIWVRDDLRFDWRMWIATRVLEKTTLIKFACACVREIWHILPDDRSRKAVEIAAAYAAGNCSEEEVTAAAADAYDAWDAASAAASAAIVVARSAAENDLAWAAAMAASAAMAARSAAESDLAWAAAMAASAAIVDARSAAESAAAAAAVSAVSAAAENAAAVYDASGDARADARAAARAARAAARAAAIEKQNAILRQLAPTITV